MSKYIIIGTFLLLLGYSIYAICRPLTYTSKGKIRVAMFGRSTMALWFKHWNWPYPLRIKSTYRSWPIKYNTYSRGGFFFEYHELPSPSEEEQFGTEMVNVFKRTLEKGGYGGAFFKFCFVDFQIDQDEVRSRFEDLTRVIRSVAKVAQESEVKLIIGNALPMPNPNKATIKLQRKFNQWLSDFPKINKNVSIFDIYSPLTDKEGRLRSSFCRGNGDLHLNDKAFSKLDKALFDELEKILAS